MTERIIILKKGNSQVEIMPNSFEKLKEEVVKMIDETDHVDDPETKVYGIIENADEEPMHPEIYEKTKNAYIKDNCIDLKNYVRNSADDLNVYLQYKLDRFEQVENDLTYIVRGGSDNVNSFKKLKSPYKIEDENDYYGMSKVATREDYGSYILGLWCEYLSALRPTQKMIEALNQ